MNTYLELSKSYYDQASKTNKLADVLSSGGDQKSTFYTKIVEEYEKQCKHDSYKEMYTHFFNRYYNAGFGSQSCKIFHVTTAPFSSIVIGNGTASVLETHISLHPMYGVPYLPGTALKGLALRAATQISALRPALAHEGEEYKILFGTTKSAGFIQFHDAFVTPETAHHALRLDVLTPHHQKYNQISVQGNKGAGPYPAPRDDDSPIPVPFLVAKGTYTIVLSCEGEVTQAKPWLDLIQSIMLYGLEHEGIGGKTNAGYGRMIPSSSHIG